MTDLQSLWFFVPAVIANLVLVTVVNLTAFAVVREREIGTLEQIMVTPIRRLEFILGKTVPFFLIGFLEASLMVRRSLPWEYRRASFGHSAIPALHSGYRPVSFHDLLYPAASDGIRFLLHHARHGLFRVCHPHREHAGGVTVSHLLGPVALLSGGSARGVSKGHRLSRLVAPDGRNGDLRIRWHCLNRVFA